MKDMNRRDSEEHLWANEMLPWQVNGSIAPADAVRLSAHLRECADCRRDLDADRELARRLSVAPVVDYAPQASLAKLMRQIDAAAPQRRSRSGFFSRKNVADGVPARSGFVLAFAAQAAALAVLAVTVAWMGWKRETAADYRTLSSAPVIGDAQLQVLFADTATTADVRAALDRVRGHIVDGPSRAGVFRVALLPTAETAGSREQVEAALALLRAEPGVRYVAEIEAP